MAKEQKQNLTEEEINSLMRELETLKIEDMADRAKIIERSERLNKRDEEDLVQLMKRGGKVYPKKGGGFKYQMGGKTRVMSENMKEMLGGRDMLEQNFQGGGSIQDIMYLGLSPQVRNQVAMMGSQFPYQNEGLVKPQMKDYKNSLEYQKARREYFKALEAQENTPTDEETPVEEAPVTGEVTYDKLTAEYDRIIDKAVENARDKDGNLDKEVLQEALNNTGIPSWEIERYMDKPENKDIAINVVTPTVDVSAWSKQREDAANMYTVDPGDLVKADNALGFVPKEGAVSTEEDAAVWKGGQWTGNEDLNLEFEAVEPPAELPKLDSPLIQEKSQKEQTQDWIDTFPQGEDIPVDVKPPMEATPIDRVEPRLLPGMDDSVPDILPTVEAPEFKPSTDRFAAAAEEFGYPLETPEDYEKAEKFLQYNEETDQWEDTGGSTDVSHIGFNTNIPQFSQTNYQQKINQLNQSNQKVDPENFNQFSKFFGDTKGGGPGFWGTLGSLVKGFGPMSMTKKAGLDTDEINYFKGIGDRPEKTLEESMLAFDRAKQDARNQILSQKAEGIAKGDEYVRSAQQRRAEQAQYDIAAMKAIPTSDIKFDLAKSGVMKDLANTQFTADQLTASGDTARDERLDKNRDAYYSALAQDYGTLGTSLQEIQKSINAGKRNKLMEEAYKKTFMAEHGGLMSMLPTKRRYKK